MPWGLFTRKSEANDDRIERMLTVIERITEMQASAQSEHTAIMKQMLDLFKVSAEPAYNPGGNVFREDLDREAALIEEGYPVDAPPRERIQWLLDKQLEAGQ